MDKKPAPIALFVYNRPDHTRRTLEALKTNRLASSSDLFVFCDGPKSEADPNVTTTREYVRTISGFNSVTAIERTGNWGLSRSIISGVTEMLERSDRVIVIEDDLVTSPHFLSFMNAGLDIYENDPSVASIHGHVYPIKEKLPDTFFLKGADCWGWATWKRAWSHFREDGRYLLSEIRKRGLSKEFDLDGAFSYTSMLDRQIVGKTDSWAIRWHASAFLDGMLTLYPGISLVENIGQDSSGTHKFEVNYSARISNSPVNMVRIPIEENANARDLFVKYFKSTKSGLVKRAISKICRLFQK